MPQAPTLMTGLKYRLAERLFHASWLSGSQQKHRLTMRLFNHCANAGHTGALSLYGHMLFQRGNSAQEKAKGARFVIKAAQAGDVHAQYQAARIYEYGCAQYQSDPAKAVTWYARAAECRHALAAQRLARAYREGSLGLAVCPHKAEQWEAHARTGGDADLH
ncbi:sel1 repeat family protein [Cobetia sp. 4B]|uniref:tetratricopeptide repeat protein n=1 Tax=Cobetia sp. 4B TaxID=2758724 RepID=UPI001C04B36A|nr:sel1 repeat family protein [Cobetia sp. 4B]MBR9756361.1 sel1 repeat family protein [Gammaproteobacteria bacterium]QWN36755.1 sel1 repeat family protein [Cobetia sp. 4B]